MGNNCCSHLSKEQSESVHRSITMKLGGEDEDAYLDNVVDLPMQLGKITFLRTASDLVATNRVRNSPRPNLAQLRFQMPQTTNQVLLEVMSTLPPFQHDETSTRGDILGPYEYISTGCVYDGEWMNGRRFGRGVQVALDGSTYEGHWHNDMHDGRGRMIHQDGDWYEGDWVRDKITGQVVHIRQYYQGKYVHYQGSWYVGEWLNDQQHGMGEEHGPDGSQYHGHYKKGLKDGHGHFTWGNGNTYNGNFVDNKMEGDGTFHWSEAGRSYVGQWLDNLMHGYGVYSWSDGKRYDGEYRYDKKNGYGEFYWTDGRFYKGQWKDGVQHGMGEYKGSQMRTGREGEWREGKRIKWTHSDSPPHKLCNGPIVESSIEYYSEQFK